MTEGKFPHWETPHGGLGGTSGLSEGNPATGAQETKPREFTTEIWPNSTSQSRSGLKACQCVEAGHRGPGCGGRTPGRGWVTTMKML